MKIRHITGDLLSVTSGIIVHGCNNKGKMANGVALEIRKKYEGVYYHYLMLKTVDGLHLGDVQFARVDSHLTIVNAITQNGYGCSKRYIDYNAVYKCFVKVFNRAKVNNVFSINIPRIGSGLEGGDFSKVLDSIKKASTDTQYEGSLNIYTLEDKL